MWIPAVALAIHSPAQVTDTSPHVGASAEAASATQTASASLPTRPVSPTLRKAAERSFHHGSSAMRNGNFEAAARAFAMAVRDDPTQPAYYQALMVAQESRVSSLLHTAAQERTTRPLAAERLLAEARGLDPTNPRITQRNVPNNIEEARTGNALASLRFVPAGELVALPNASVHSFHESTDTRAFAQELGTAYGLRIALDVDVQSRPFRIDLDDADYKTTLRIFDMLADVFATPLDAHTILLATDNPANRKRLEHLLQETIPLPGYSTAQINEAGNMLRTVFELEPRQVLISALLQALVVRAPEGTLHAMDAVLSDLISGGREVTIDVKLYSVDTTKVRNLGVVLPTSFTAFSARSEIQNVLNSNSALIQQLIANGALPATATPAQIAAYLVFVAGLGSNSILKNTFFIFGGGLSTLTSNYNSFGLTPIGLATGSYPSLNFALQKSEAVALDDLQLRVADQATATFKAGIRYPIQTSIFSDIASRSSSSGTLAALAAKYLGTGASTLNTSAVVPQFQFEDLGLTVNAIPRVLNRNEVSLQLEVKVSALAGSALNGIPVLASRLFSSTLTVEDGQTLVMASNLQDSEAAVVTGIPGLNSVPGLGNLTNRSTNAARSNVVLLVTPHIVRHAHDVAKGPYVPLPPRPDDD